MRVNKETGNAYSLARRRNRILSRLPSTLCNFLQSVLPKFNVGKSTIHYGFLCDLNAEKHTYSYFSNNISKYMQ